MFRIIRIGRIFRVFKGFKSFFVTSTEILPLFSRYLGVLFCLYYVFAMIGMECFAGIIPDFASNANATLAVRQSSFGQSDFYSNNFNHFGSSMVTLWELMVG